MRNASLCHFEYLISHTFEPPSSVFEGAQGKGLLEENNNNSKKLLSLTNAKCKTVKGGFSFVQSALNCTLGSHVLVFLLPQTGVACWILLHVFLGVVS